MRTQDVKQIPGLEIPGGTPLWRYMDIPKFMLLLRGKAFIPTLGELQRRDRKEGFVPLHSEDYLPEHFFKGDKDRSMRDWLEAKMKTSRRLPMALGDNLASGFFNNNCYFREWLDQLAVRRAVWCWAAPNPCHERQESMAMWNLYAKSGVAVKTTLDHVASALKIPDETQVMVAKVQYHPQGYFTPLLLEEQLLRRPFVFKNQSYDYEREVRLVFRIRERAKPPGVQIDVDLNELLTTGELVISPYMPGAEATAFRKMVRARHPKIQVRQSAEQQESPFEIDQAVERFLSLRQPSRLRALRDFHTKCSQKYKVLRDNPVVFRTECGLPALLLDL